MEGKEAADLPIDVFVHRLHFVLCKVKSTIQQSFNSILGFQYVIPTEDETDKFGKLLPT